MDHIGGVPFHCATRALIGVPPTQLYGRADVCSAVRDIVAVHSRVEDQPIPIDILVVEEGDEVTLQKGGFVIKPFAVNHVKKKLKHEYAGLPGNEIAALRKSGAEVTTTVQVPEVAFTGDTTISFVTDPRNADVLNARVLIMECTFIDDKVGIEDAHKLGHLHVQEIAEHASKFKNEAILLVHFSARFKAEEIVEALDKHLPKDLRQRVHPFFEAFSLR